MKNLSQKIKDNIFGSFEKGIPLTNPKKTQYQTGVGDYPEGTIKEWKGGKYMKRSGKWYPYHEKTGEVGQQAADIDEQKEFGGEQEYSEKQLASHASQTDSETLKNFINKPVEEGEEEDVNMLKMKEAAKKELAKRGEFSTTSTGGHSDNYKRVNSYSDGDYDLRAPSEHPAGDYVSINHHPNFGSSYTHYKEGKEVYSEGGFKDRNEAEAKAKEYLDTTEGGKNLDFYKERDMKNRISSHKKESKTSQGSIQASVNELPYSEEDKKKILDHVNNNISKLGGGVHQDSLILNAIKEVNPSLTSEQPKEELKEKEVEPKEEKVELKEKMEEKLVKSFGSDFFNTEQFKNLSDSEQEDIRLFFIGTDIVQSQGKEFLGTMGDYVVDNIITPDEANELNEFISDASENPEFIFSYGERGISSVIGIVSKLLNADKYLNEEDEGILTELNSGMDRIYEGMSTTESAFTTYNEKKTEKTPATENVQEPSEPPSEPPTESIEGEEGGEEDRKFEEPVYSKDEWLELETIMDDFGDSYIDLEEDEETGGPPLLWDSYDHEYLENPTSESVTDHILDKVASEGWDEKTEKFFDSLQFMKMDEVTGETIGWNDSFSEFTKKNFPGIYEKLKEIVKEKYGKSLTDYKSKKKQKSFLDRFLRSKKYKNLDDSQKEKVKLFSEGVDHIRYNRFHFNKFLSNNVDNKNVTRDEAETIMNFFVDVNQNPYRFLLSYGGLELEKVSAIVNKLNNLGTYSSEDEKKTISEMNDSLNKISENLQTVEDMEMTELKTSKSSKEKVEKFKE